MVLDIEDNNLDPNKNKTLPEGWKEDNPISFLKDGKQARLKWVQWQLELQALSSQESEDIKVDPAKDKMLPEGWKDEKKLKHHSLKE